MALGVGWRRSVVPASHDPLQTATQWVMAGGSRSRDARSQDAGPRGSAPRVRHVLSYLSGFLSAVALSVIVEVTTGGVTKLIRRTRLFLASRADFDPDTIRDGLFMLGEWSPARRLVPQHLVTTHISKTERPPQVYFDADDLARTVASRTTDTGEIVYITAFKQDHKESDETQDCRVTLAESNYAEVRAIEEMRTTTPQAFESADLAVQRAGEYVRGAVPSSVAINVVLVTEDGELLCAKRSNAVDNGIGLWTVGVFETMKRTDPNRPGQQEDFYLLGERALKEELGLTSHDHSPLDMAWVGIYQPLLRGHVVAVTRLRISKQDLVDRARRSDSSYEHAGFDWLPLTRATVKSFADAPPGANPAGVGATLWVHGREWLEQSRLGVTEAWRFRVVLQGE